MAALEQRLNDRLAALEQIARETSDLAHGELRALLRSVAAEDSENRRRLARLRESAGYDRPFVDEDPLVSITVATCGRAELLTSRCLPSILSQTHENIEVVV